MSTTPPPPPVHVPSTGSRSRTPWVVAVVLLAVVALATSGTAAVQAARVGDVRERAIAAETEVKALERRVAELEAAAAQEPDASLDGLLGEGGGLDDLLGGLLGEGGLDGLLGEGGLDGLLGEGGLEDLLGDGGLDGLLGEGGGLDGLLGGGAALGDLARCVVPGEADDDMLPQDAAAAVDVIADRVSADRELAFPAPVDATLLAPDALASRVEADVTAAYGDAEADRDQRLLAAIGAVSPDTDVRAALTELFAEQVAGFYDPDTGELVVGAAGDVSEPSTQVFLAHELTHALTDDAIGLPDLEALADGDDDAALAAQAVVEGDATLAMQRYAVTHLGLAEQLAMAGGVDAGATADVPPYLLAQLTFPYVEGLAWVCGRFAAGGWAAVDAAYAAPPRTTLEVLDPSMVGFEPESVAVAGAPGPDWTELEATTFGAAELQFLLAAPGGDPEVGSPDARDEALAWRGGRITLWDRDGATAVSLRLAAADGELCTDVTDAQVAAFPGATVAREDATTVLDTGTQWTVVTCTGTVVAVGVGPTERDARAAATS